MTWPVGTAVQAELDALHAECVALRERFYASNKALANSEARLAEAEALLREARPCVESWQRKHERALKAAKKRTDDHHAEWHGENVAQAVELQNRIDAFLKETAP